MTDRIARITIEGHITPEVQREIDKLNDSRQEFYEKLQDAEITVEHGQIKSGKTITFIFRFSKESS